MFQLAFKKKNLEPIICILFFLILSILYYKLYINRVYSIHFVDEDHHMIIGSLIDDNTKLYKDLSTNHQPIPFLIANSVNKFIKHKEIKLLVKYNRFFIFSYGLIWFAFLVSLLKSKGLILMAIFEYLKYQYFGNMLLGESLAVYPLMYLFFVFIDVIWEKKKVLKLNTYIQGLIISVSVFIVIFNLAWLWPFVLAFLLVLYLKKRKLFYLSFCFLSILTILFFTFVINFRSWFIESIWNMVKYTIPSFNQGSSNKIVNMLSFLFLPLKSIWEYDSLTGFLTLIVLLITIYVWLNNKEDWRRLLLVYFMLFLTNNRVLSLGHSYYSGFHFLPWIGAFGVFTISVFDFYWKCFYKNKFAQICLILIITSIIAKHKPAKLWSSNREYEYYINYSEIDDYNWVLKNISEDKEKMFVTNITPLLFYGTNLIPAGRQVDYYPWQHIVPQQKQDMVRDIENKQISYIFTNGEADYLDGFKEYKNNNFRQIYKNNGLTGLWIRNDKIINSSKELSDKLIYRGFSFNIVE